MREKLGAFSVANGWRLFAIETRSLSAFRIALATLILLDLGLRSRFIAANYTDEGVLPLKLYTKTPFWFEIHTLSGSYAFQLFLFAITAIFATMLLLGYRARIATLACWILVSSLQLRNTYLLDGGDRLLRICLFWSMFLPLGARFSLDCLRRPKSQPQTSHVLSAATIAILLQFVFLYLFAGVTKDGAPWRSTGTAIELVLGDVYWTKPLGHYMSQFPALLAVLTPLVRWFELLGPFILFVPWRTDSARVLGVCAFLLFQLSLWLSIQLNLFSWVASSLTLLFLPASVWDKVAQSRRKPQPQRAAALSPPRAQPVPALVASLVLYALLMNLHSAKLIHLPRGFFKPAQSLGILQDWRMYAPKPADFTYSFTVRGRLSDGQTVDLMQASSHHQWEPIKRLHASYRFRYYLEKKKPNTHRRRYLSWLCRRYNEAQGAYDEAQGDGPTLQKVEYTGIHTEILTAAQRSTSDTKEPWIRRSKAKRKCRGKR